MVEETWVMFAFLFSVRRQLRRTLRLEKYDMLRGVIARRLEMIVFR